MIHRILNTPDLVSFWDLGRSLTAHGPHPATLTQPNGPVPIVHAPASPFSPTPLRFGDGPYLMLPRADLGPLNIHGTSGRAQVTVLTYLKRTNPGFETGCQAVAGIWNEHAQRQYCLFLNLHIHDSAQQVGAHISGIGGATPGFKYCMDAAIGATPVPYDIWQCCAITYDGAYARAYLNGRLDARGDRNPYAYDLGIFSPTSGGGDFTVGAVPRPETVDENFNPIGAVVANRFHGLLAGLAVFNRALSAPEIAALSVLPSPPAPERSS